MINKIEDFDICIVGASIAGNYLGYLLSNTNLKIAILEEHTEIGLPLQCAGIVSQKITDLIDLPKEIVLNRVNVAKIISSSGKFIRLAGTENPYIIDRIALDRYFFNKIKDKKDIHYYLGEKLKHFKYIKEEHQKFILVQTSRRKLKVKLLVGCDGPLTLVGKHFNEKNKVLYARQIRIETSFDQNEAVMYFDRAWKELFGWIVPEGNNIFRIGLASSQNTSKNFKNFLKRLNINSNRKIDQQGGIIPYGFMNKVAFDNVLLLGDSAGQVKATTGGGIIMLLTAALYASNCIRKNFKSNNFSKDVIKKYYESPCLTKIGKELKIHYIIRLFLAQLRENDFERFLQLAKISKIERLISFYGDMDFPKSLVIKLIFKPLILRFLLKFLIKNPFFLIRVIKTFLS
ncbi:MAG: NAD(P)/FAD-dependent oxidoreductase [Candidatus Heimdallarchaeota archaeon]